MNSTLDYEEVLDQIIMFAGRVIPYDTASILLNHGLYTTVKRATGCHRYPAETSSWQIPIAETYHLRQMTQTKQPCIIPDTHNDQRWIMMPAFDWVRSYVGAPIIVEDTVVGFLNFDSATPGFYSADIADSLQAFADQAAIAMRNARLYEQLQSELEERRRVEISLRDNEARLQGILDGASDAIITMDTDFHIVMVNPAAETMFGYKSRCLIGKDAQTLLPERMREQYKYYKVEFDGTDSAGHFIASAPFQHGRRANGEEFPMHVSISQVQGQELYTAFVRDVTEQVAAEQAIRQHLNHLTLISNISNEIGSVLDMRLLLQRAALLVQKLFDYHHVAIFLVEGHCVRLKAIAGHYENLFPYDHTQPKTVGIIGWVVSNGKPLVVNDVSKEPLYVSLARDRTQTRSELTVPIIQASQSIGVIDIQSPHLNCFSDIDVIAIETLARQIAVAMNTAWLYEQARQEIRERQQMEETLRANEARLKVVSELTSDYAYAGRFSPDGGFALEWITGAGMRITGYADAELMDSRLWEKLIVPEDLPKVRRHLRKITTGKPQIMRFRLIDKDGNMHWIEDNMYPVWDDNHVSVVGIIGAARDITEQRQIEEAMQRAQKLESLGVLASGIAHDFNNLLMAIMGQGTLASLKVNQPQAARQHLDNVLQTVERAALLTRQLLAYTGKGHVTSEPINLNHLIEQNVAILQAALPKNVALETSLKPHLPNVMADQGQMQQVVMNLIVNAAEAYDGRPGKVTIVTNVKQAPTEILHHIPPSQGTPTTEVVHMSVIDEGVGMSAETQARIFDPFYTTKLTGRGLGLAAVLGIVHHHQGTIQLESEPGKGTTFHVLLPTTTADEVAPVPAPPTPTAVPTGCILVVDDEPVIRAALVDLLKLQGFTTLAADNGKTALALFAERLQEIDLVVMDMTMPVLSGEAAYYKMINLRDDIPVIFLSGYEEEETFRHKVNKKSVSFLHKPFDFRDLLKEIQSLLGNRIAV
ncbi:MAG: PAS domain S-box protein [Anaerolineae bacterium]|nr:PAS domain S-box protein [Anaerolineae bacterium]